MSLIDKIKKIAEVNKQYTITREIKLGDVRLVIAPLTTDEDMFLRAYIKDVTDDGQKNAGAQYQVAIVALAIKKIDEIEVGFASPDDFIETGELREDGVPEKKERFTLMMDLLASIDSYIVSELFDIVSDVLLQVETNVKRDFIPAYIPNPPKKPTVAERGELSRQHQEADSQGSLIVENKESGPNS